MDTMCEPGQVILVLALVTLPLNIWWTFRRHQIIREAKIGILRQLKRDRTPHAVIVTRTRMWKPSALSYGWLWTEAIVTSNSLVCFLLFPVPFTGRRYSNSMIQLLKQPSNSLYLLPDVYVATIDCIQMDRGDLVITFTDRKRSLKAPTMFSFGAGFAIAARYTLTLKDVASRGEFDTIKQLLSIDQVQ